MSMIRSVEDLNKARLEALERQRAVVQKYRFHLRINMASCSIAAGARDTLKAINQLIASESIPGVSADQVHITQTGCNGLCALEPLVQVQIADQPPVTYGKVRPEVARRILQDHLSKGLIVQENMIESI
jgi:NADP-reducing hydrogenase subunit HndB